jgi:hypothetical protein
METLDYLTGDLGNLERLQQFFPGVRLLSVRAGK